MNFPRPKSKSKTPDSQKNLTRSPNLSPVPSTFNMKSMNFSLKRQNTAELNQSQLRKSFGPINRRK